MNLYKAHNMKFILLAFIVALSFAACKTDVNTANTQEKGSEAKKNIKGEHNPPIEKSEVTDGHWYCDMGTVHFTRADKGDGKCEICGMKLHHKTEKTK